MKLTTPAALTPDSITHLLAADLVFIFQQQPDGLTRGHLFYKSGDDWMLKDDLGPSDDKGTYQWVERWWRGRPDARAGMLSLLHVDPALTPLEKAMLPVATIRVSSSYRKFCEWMVNHNITTLSD